MLDRAFVFNAEKFAVEVFPDEVVVLDVIEGTYFSLGGATADIWAPLTTGASLTEIAAALSTKYPLAQADVAQALDALAAELMSEDILKAASESGATIEFTDAGGKGTFPGFPVEKHDDMQDLLTLDPIHDVDQTAGWPRR